jgi:hypothetical protein
MYSRLLFNNAKTETYRSIILSVVLCMYDSWLLTLRYENKLRVFGVRMSRKTYGDNTTGIDTDRDKLHYLYLSPNAFRLIKSKTMNGKNMFRSLECRAYAFLVGTLEGAKPRQRHKHRWAYTIMMH